MSLRDRIKAANADKGIAAAHIFERFGVLGNPFPPSSQTTNNPHRRTRIDDEIDVRIESFIRDHKTQVVVVEGTQGTGKTNVLNFYESEIADVLTELSGFYVIRYLADPEASFEGTIRRLFQELGTPHLLKLAAALDPTDADIFEDARSVEVRTALRKLAQARSQEVAELLLDWFLGMRVLKSHRELLGVNFRLDTVEAKTAALRDLILVSSKADVLSGVFLLLDELEKQDGVLSPTAVVRYLSALRAIIDALPNHLFMMLAVTPDALRRYSVAVPAFRSRLQNKVELQALQNSDEALALAHFYLEHAAKEAQEKQGSSPPVGHRAILSDEEIRDVFEDLVERAKKSADPAPRQRIFLHHLHERAEQAIHNVSA